MVGLFAAGFRGGLVAGGLGFATGLGSTVNVAVAAVASATPAREVAVASTRSSTFAPYGSSVDGVKTRTVVPSAQRAVPGTAAPAAVAWKAAAVVVRSMRSVNRTDNAELRGISVLPVARPEADHASVALAAGTLSLVGIAEAWHPWWLLWQLPGAFVFLVAALAELQRPPFDMPVADSEIVFGAYTEYTGLRFAFFLLAEYAGIVVMSLLFAVLFLGGWAGPFEHVARLAVDAAQGFVVAVVMIWMRVSWPRMREDQLQRLAWVWLVPIALLQLALTAVGVVMTA